MKKWTICLWEKAEKDGAVQPEEWKAPGGFYQCVQKPDGSWEMKRTEPDCSQRSPVPAEETVSINWSYMKAQISFSAVEVTQIAQRGCRVSILRDIQNPTRHSSEQPAAIELTLSKELRLEISRGTLQPQSFYYSMILQFTFSMTNKHYYLAVIAKIFIKNRNTNKQLHIKILIEISISGVQDDGIFRIFLLLCRGNRYKSNLFLLPRELNTTRLNLL